MPTHEPAPPSKDPWSEDPYVPRDNAPHPLAWHPGWDIKVDVTENPVIGTIYGPDGETILLEITERPQIGFCKPD